MTAQPLKLSEIMKEMSEVLLRHPSEVPSSEAAHNDINAMIDEVIQYMKNHYQDDRRRILTCGIPDGKIRVEWHNAAAPGVDAKWEMRLYGLVRTVEREKAIRFLQETRGMSNKEAAIRVAAVAAELGMK